MINIVEWWKIIVFHHVCLEIDANLEWLIELESWKLKYEIKELLFATFRQNKPLKPKNLACLGVG